MVYLLNDTETQRVHIPRTDIEASAYHPSTGGTERYYAGTNIEITPTNIINVTGLTEAIESTVTGMTLDYATTGDVETMISAATSDFVTSGDVQSQITSQTQNFVTSGDVETMISGLTTTGDVETMISEATDDFVTSDDVDSMISSATSGMATTQDVENAVSGKADTTAVTQSISDALTAYTPTNDFATINGSAITEGGDIVIEGGGDASSVEMITELPADPVDGAVYNYNGTLVKFVDGAGDWGYWTDAESMLCYGTWINGGATLFYGVIPASMDGQMAFGIARIVYNPSDSDVRCWGFFNLQNNTIDCYDNKDKTGSTLVSVVKNSGSESSITFRSLNVYVSWNDNVLQIRANDKYCQLVRQCETSASTAHYELAQELPYNYPITTTVIYPNSTGSFGDAGYLSQFDAKTGRAFPARQIGTQTVLINTSKYGVRPMTFYGTANPLERMYVPTASGQTGSLLVSQGAESAPVFQTIAQALGIDFWTGTQAEYDAMASHNATTLYIIVEDNS